MTQNDKELLLKDLCGRLPYGIKCYIPESNEVKTLGGIHEDGENTLFDFLGDSRKIVYGTQLYISEFKPYLFPMSSMTEEQEMEYDATFATIVYEDGKRDSAMTYKSFDWLNKNHFDYRGLINKGLGIDATGLNIY